jgi:retron-type reverse transcriptase
MNYAEFVAAAAKLLRTSSVEVERIIMSAPYRYKHYTINKRSGGLRDIHHPSPALKVIQRWIANDLLSELPVHDCVYSYRRGRNISMHAAQHVTSNYVTRFDFSDFFPSINGAVVRRLLKQAINNGLIDFEDKVVDAVVRLVCRSDQAVGRLVLSIGAPSSPHLSNAILYNFDLRMSQVARDFEGIYTRYADDIYLSSMSRASLEKMESQFVEAVAKSLPYLNVNERKTQRLSRKRRMSVTGLNITPKRQLSVGRDLKRGLKTKVYLAIHDRLSLEEMTYLKGMLSHVRSVEPDFILSLFSKFGRDAVEAIMR